jgi:predicted component of type VI protein secretion system
MQVRLVMFSSEGDRRAFALTRDMTVIGRREDCDLRIPLGNVSRKHCRLVKDDNVVRVEDLGSSNGTYRNGERVQEATLEPGDTVKVGPVSFVVQIDGVPAEDEIQQPTAGAAMGAAAGAVTAGGDDEELEILDDEPLVEDLEEATGNEANLDDFDPMSALGGSDSGINMEGEQPPPGDSMQIDIDGDEKK